METAYEEVTFGVSAAIAMGNIQVIFHSTKYLPSGGHINAGSPP